MRTGTRTVRGLPLLLTTLCAVILIPVVGLLSRADPPRVYTVAQMATMIAAHPQAWIGRTAAVRGIAHGIRRHQRCRPGAACRLLFYLFDTEATSAIPVVVDLHPDSPLTPFYGWPLIGRLLPLPQPVTPSFYRPATYQVLFQATTCIDEPCLVADLKAVAGA